MIMSNAACLEGGRGLADNIQKHLLIFNCAFCIVNLTVFFVFHRPCSSFSFCLLAPPLKGDAGREFIEYELSRCGVQCSAGRSLWK